MGNGAFSVGASHVDGTETPVRRPEVGVKSEGIIEICLVSGFAFPVVHRELCEHPVESFFVIHGNFFLLFVVLLGQRKVIKSGL